MPAYSLLAFWFLSPEIRYIHSSDIFTILFIKIVGQKTINNVQKFSCAKSWKLWFFFLSIFFLSNSAAVGGMVMESQEGHHSIYAKNRKKISGKFLYVYQNFPILFSKWVNNSPILRKMGQFWETYKMFPRFSYDFPQWMHVDRIILAQHGKGGEHKAPWRFVPRPYRTTHSQHRKSAHITKYVDKRIFTPFYYKLMFHNVLFTKHLRFLLFIIEIY